MGYNYPVVRLGKLLDSPELEYSDAMDVADVVAKKWNVKLNPEYPCYTDLLFPEERRENVYRKTHVLVCGKKGDKTPKWKLWSRDMLAEDNLSLKDVVNFFKSSKEALCKEIDEKRKVLVNAFQEMGRNYELNPSGLITIYTVNSDNFRTGELLYRVLTNMCGGEEIIKNPEVSSFYKEIANEIMGKKDPLEKRPWYIISELGEWLEPRVLFYCNIQNTVLGLSFYEEKDKNNPPSLSLSKGIELNFSDQL